MLEKFSANHVWVGDPPLRCYQVGENIYPGVTTILSATKSKETKRALGRWRASVGDEEAERITKKACERGSIVHNLIENHLIGIRGNFPAHVQGFWDSIRPVLDNVSDVQLIEGAVHHHVLKFAGSVDCVARWKGGDLAIIDWKTASKPKKQEWITDYKQQTAAYASCVNRLYGTRINRSVIVIALKDRPAQVFEINPQEIMEHWRNFSERVKIYHATHLTE